MRKDDEKAAFEKTIAENPYDADTRKVFADWLEENGFDDEAVIQRDWTAKKMRAAEKWLGQLAEQCEMTRDELVQAAHGFLDRGDMIGADFDGLDDPEIFWAHFMVVTGRPVPDDKRGEMFIVCAC
jgi:uncharacterized protein (TIGR02996 family)